MHLRLVGPHEAVALVGIVVGFGLLAIGGRRALVHAKTEGPKVVAGMRLAVASLVMSMVGAGLNGLVYYSETSCGAGAPGTSLPALCTLNTVSTVLLVVAALMFLGSLVGWPPWDRPLRLQLARATVGLGWLFALALALLATGFISTGFAFGT